MRNLIKSIQDNRRLIIGIILAPGVMYISSIIMLSIFRLGNDLGTVLRHLYSMIVC